MPPYKSIEVSRVYREELMLPPYELTDPYCHECISHAARINGYVQLHRDGFHLAHRWVYWQYTGEIPEEIMHLCDNRGCLNISHLRPCTHIENLRDMVEKGRDRFHGSVRLSDDVVRAIRLDMRLHREIAVDYGISSVGVSLIKRRQIHSRVPD